MKLLCDTHILCWGAIAPTRLSAKAVELLSDPENVLIFSVVTLWEVAIKRALGKKDFPVDAGPLRAGLLANDYLELAITGDHALKVSELPLLHKDPFDRLLVAQAMVEGALLLTSDADLEQYGNCILKL